MTPTITDLNIEIRSANGSSMDFYQTDPERIAETLGFLAAPRLFAQPHLLVTSELRASMIPCKGIDLILARTSARTPLSFPVNLPVGLFDLVEQPDDRLEIELSDITDNRQVAGAAEPHISRVEVQTIGGWTVNLKTVAMIRGNVHDERQFFSHLPALPTIPFRLEEGGFGLINTANITCASACPKPKALPGPALPLEWRRHNPSFHGRGKPMFLD